MESVISVHFSQFQSICVTPHNAIEHTDAKALVSTLEHQVWWGDTMTRDVS